jgi:hypothetical protein
LQVLELFLNLDYFVVGHRLELVAHQSVVLYFTLSQYMCLLFQRIQLILNIFESLKQGRIRPSLLDDLDWLAYARLHLREQSQLLFQVVELVDNLESF